MKPLNTSHFLSGCKTAITGLTLQMGLSLLLAQENPGTNQPPQKAWGAICEGFTLAISFPKSTFTNGEPITGAVLLRNVTTNSLGYYENVPSFKELTVTNEHQVRLQLKESLRPKTPFEERMSKVVSNPMRIWVDAGKEGGFPIRVDSFFDMPPGAYSVSFHLRLPPQKLGQPNADAYSGSVTIRVLDR